MQMNFSVLFGGVLFLSTGCSPSAEQPFSMDSATADAKPIVRSAETPEEAVARVGSNALVWDAFSSYRSIFQARCLSVLPWDRDAIIPPEHWKGALHALNPRYVHFDDYNIVAVLETTDEVETGLYIVSPISSTGMDKEIWSATRIVGGIYAVTRKRETTAGIDKTP